MFNERRVTVGDLFDEGRRFVLEVGEYHEGEGFRAIIVFENHPGYFPSGELSNRPDAAPVLWWRTSDRQEAERMACSHSEATFGLSRMEHMKIVMSSIGAQHKSGKVRVTYDQELARIWLRNGFGQEMELEEEHAVTLYQDLARTMDLPYRPNCSECGMLLDEDEYCGWCEG